jgi:hypothetical protein
MEVLLRITAMIYNRHVHNLMVKNPQEWWVGNTLLWQMEILCGNCYLRWPF